MNILKNKKQLILGILIDILICIFAFIIFFFSLNNETVEVSYSNNVSSNILIAELGNTSLNIEEVPKIVTDDKATEKELKEEKVDKKEVQKSTSPYYIKINYKANVVTIYKKDKDDKYTVPYKAMVCSCGTATPRSGTYKTSSKYRWGKLIHDVYGQYATRIVGSILFHSVPYSSNTNDSLLYNQYDKLGTKASAGCVRLTVADSKWIYDNCPKGTLVEFYSNSDPGPLGKPTAQKISSVEECRNWDPTDPASNNPWHTYKPEEEKPNQDIENTVTNNISNNIITNSNNNLVINNNVVENSIISNNTTVNNSIITNNTIINTNSTTNDISNSGTSNNTITDTNNVVNNNINNNITNNTITNSNNTVTGNNVQNNNPSTENSSTSNNIVTENNNVTNKNNTVNNSNNLVVNNTI